MGTGVRNLWVSSGPVFGENPVLRGGFGEGPFLKPSIQYRGASAKKRPVIGGSDWIVVEIAGCITIGEDDSFCFEQQTVKLASTKPRTWGINSNKATFIFEQKWQNPVKKGPPSFLPFARCHFVPPTNYKFKTVLPLFMSIYLGGYTDNVRGITGMKISIQLLKLQYIQPLPHLNHQIHPTHYHSFPHSFEDCWNGFYIQILRDQSNGNSSSGRPRIFRRISPQVVLISI